MSTFRLLVLLALVLVGRDLAADDRPSEEVIRSAISRSLPLLKAGAVGAVEHKRKCFMCHNQALPVFALTTARDRGFELDEAFLQQQMQHTSDFLAKNK